MKLTSCSLVVICIFAHTGRVAEADIFRQKTPIELLRETANFLSSQPDQRLKQDLRGLQGELFKTNYQQLFKDILDSGVLSNKELEDGIVQRVENLFQPQECAYAAFATDGNTTTPVNNITTSENGNATTETYSTTTMLENITTTVNVSTTPSSNATTPVPTAPTPKVNPTCLNHTSQMLVATVERKPWALRMLDAGGKPSPNLEAYQLFWVGDDEECTSVTAVDNSTGTEQVLFKGRYCTAVIPLQPFDIRKISILSAHTVAGDLLGILAFAQAPKSLPIWSPATIWAGDQMGTNMGQQNIPRTEGRSGLPLTPALPPTGLRVGLCVPDTCSGQDITLLLNGVLASQPNISYRVGLTICQEEKIDYDTKAVAALTICSLFIVLMVIGTLWDLLAVQRPAWSAQTRVPEGDGPVTDANGYTLISQPIVDRPTTINIKEEGEEQPLLGKKQKTPDSEEPGSEEPGIVSKVLLAFSVYTNGKKILNASHSPGSITCIHGIRFISMTWVILGHTFIFGLTTAENYLTYLKDVQGLWTFQAILGAPVAVDTFFSLSGLLVTYLILKEMDRRGGKVQWFLFYFHRFWRLTPPYALVMMMLVCLFRYFGSGPNWPQQGTELNYCEDTWWTNLLYVNNFVKVKEMCINWSWYLANDMQFYVISPLLFVPLFFWRRVGVVLALLWLVATVTTAGVIARVNHFPPSVGIGEQLDIASSADYFADFYIKPYCRFGPYVVGMLTGYTLYITKSQVKMNLVTWVSGWALSTATGLAAVYGLYGPANGDPMTSDVSALYNAMSHTVWGAAVCWVIFACATGHGGPVNSLLSWTAFIPLSRLTYMAYLVHPIIMNLYHLGAPSAYYLSSFHSAILFLGFSVAAFGTAFLLSLAFEAPMMALEKVLLPKPKKP